MTGINSLHQQNYQQHLHDRHLATAQSSPGMSRLFKFWKS